MQIGTVKQIWRYAVKSMAGEQLESCSVGTLGIPADRGWAVRDETTGETTNGKRTPLLMQCEARYREAPVDGAIPHVVMSTPRCGMTLQAQKNLPKDPSILRSIVKDAKQNFGIYASVVTAGDVRVGDVVEVN